MHGNDKILARFAATARRRALTSCYIDRRASVIDTAEPIALADYWDALNAFDWGYEWSDDHSVYEAGRAQLEALRGRATLSPAHARLFHDFEAHERARHHLLVTVPDKPRRPDLP